jgi:hypothetical protein
MKKRSLRLLCLVGALFSGCCGVASFTPPQVDYTPLLGRPFGILLKMDCELVDAPPSMRAIDPVLHVTAIEGETLDAPIHMRWIYGGSVPSEEFESPCKGPAMSLASRYVVTGYECGHFVGEPNGVWEITSPLYGPRPTSFHFVRLLHVLTVAPAN